MDSLNKINPLNTNINKGNFLNSGRKQNIIRNTQNQQRIVQTRKSKVKINPAVHFRPNSIGIKKQSVNTQKSIPASTHSKIQEDLSLPDDCFFINEKREDLPFDPVELSKLKLIKQKAIQNLNRTINTIRARSNETNGENQISKYNAEIADLDLSLIHI